MDLNIDNQFKVILVFDQGGNVYFKFLNKLYELNIDNKNILSCDLCPLSSEQFNCVKLNYGELKLTSQGNSLKGKAQRNLNDQDLNEFDEEDEENKDDLYPDEVNKYLYEDKQYTEYYESDENHTAESIMSNSFDQEDLVEESVKFLSNGQEIEIWDYDDIVSLYDTLVYNDDPDHGFITFKTTLIGINPSYRLKIYKNGILSFRPLGEREKNYKLNICEDILSLKILI